MYLVFDLYVHASSYVIDPYVYGSGSHVQIGFHNDCDCTLQKTQVTASLLHIYIFFIYISTHREKQQLVEFYEKTDKTSTFLVFTCLTTTLLFTSKLIQNSDLSFLLSPFHFNTYVLYSVSKIQIDSKFADPNHKKSS